MPTFKVNIRTGNAAFADDPRPELARLLHDIAQRVQNGCMMDHHRTIHDSNGNDVGRFVMVEDES